MSTNFPREFWTNRIKIFDIDDFYKIFMIINE